MIDAHKAEDWREFAESDFTPWQHQADEWTPPTNSEWIDLANPHLVTVRMAWCAMFMTKPELMKMFRDMDEESGRKFAQIMTGSIEWFKQMVTILEAAEVRMLCAGMALEFEEGGADE